MKKNKLLLVKNKKLIVNRKATNWKVLKANKKKKLRVNLKLQFV